MLYPYQHVGVAFLSSRKTALLADEMGLGKSAQAITACDDLLAEKVVVVCPASVQENWRREFKKFGSHCTPAVISYDKLARCWPADCLNDIDVLVIDESHYLKNKTAKRTKAIFGDKCDGVGGLVACARRVYLLTGTPMPNAPNEIWPMLRACAPEAITGTGKPWSYWQFVSKFCKTQDRGFGPTIVGGKNLEQLRERLQPFMLRRTKAEVLPDLPELRIDELFVEANVDRIKGWEEAAQERLILQTLKEKGVDGLREIAPHVATLRRLTGLAKVAPCVAWVRDWLDGGGGKIVLFAHHREVIEALEAAFLKMSMVNPVVVTGSTSTKDRQDLVDVFQNCGNPIFIGQIQAAGTGINLTAASDVLFVESSWVPSDNAQAAARIHRIGQKNACMVRFATLAGSIDEQIQRAVARKTRDITALFAA